MNQAALVEVFQARLGTMRSGWFSDLVERDGSWGNPADLRPVQVHGQRKEPRGEGGLAAPFRQSQGYMRERQRISDRNTRGGIRLAGLIIFAAGGGLMVFFDALRDGPPPALGALPLLVGLALILYGQFVAPKD